jgi:hypothetical protein
VVTVNIPAGGSSNSAQDTAEIEPPGDENQNQDAECRPLCCPLNPSESALNEAKTRLLDALTEQAKAGNLPEITLDIQ